MEFMTYVYLGYSFVSLYFLFLFILIYIQRKKEMIHIPPLTKKYSISFIVPCYNEEKYIGKTIENLVNNGYSNLKKIIVVDDCSTDDSYEVVKKYVKKYPGMVKLVKTPKNTGNAAGAKNYGCKFVKTELIAFTDADSFPEKGSIEKMIGYFDDPKMGVVVGSIFVQNSRNFLSRLQHIEYIIIKFSRKLMEFIDSIFVTPGPLVVYRKKIFDEIGGFDSKNMTEDLEITWNIICHGYKVKMNVSAKVYTVVPEKWKEWFNQRIRWNIGGYQAMIKYRKRYPNSGMLGYYIMPMFLFYWFISLFGLGLASYRIFTWIVSRYLDLSYSVGSNVALIVINDISFNPDILFFFGIVLFGISIVFTLIAYFDHNEKRKFRKDFKKPGPFIIITYMTIYLAVYPIIMVGSIYRFIRGKRIW